MKVLIATDGSVHSENAIDRYLGTVFTADDVIRIVSVVEPATHIIGAPFGVVDDYYEKFIAEARRIAEAHILEAKNKVSSVAVDGNISAEILIGSPCRSIVDDAAAWGAELIVVGSHGRGFWERVYLGSVSNAVLHHAPCSVFIVRN
ncbi:MAG: universal stress protein [Pyrinomonadaceae bacterium]|nr:universal stress protein [Pyrinomonadaceae bacterium]